MKHRPTSSSSVQVTVWVGFKPPFGVFVRRQAYKNEMENLKQLLQRHLLINGVTAADSSDAKEFMS